MIIIKKKEPKQIMPTVGIVFRATRDITKEDILCLCRLLNQRKHYQNVCTIEPEEICGGGLKFVFVDSNQATYYKSMHLNIPWGKWGWIKHAMARVEWKKEKYADLLFQKDDIKTFAFVTHSDAPAFTIGEMFYWEECLARIGLVRAPTNPKKNKKPVCAKAVRSFKNSPIFLKK